MQFLCSDVNAFASSDYHTDGLVDGIDGIEDVDIVAGGDAKDVDGVDEAIYNTVLRLDTDGDLTTGGGEGIVAEEIWFGGFRFGFGFRAEGKAGGAEGGEGGESTRWREPFAGLEEDVGSVNGLERKGKARHSWIR